MDQREPLPSVYFDEITDVQVTENLVRVTVLAGKHVLRCVLTPEQAEDAHDRIGAVLAQMKPPQIRLA